MRLKHAPWSVLFLSGFLGACAPSGSSPDPEAVPEIMARWTIIERSFLTTTGIPESAAFFKELDDFSKAVLAFLDSRMYSMYRTYRYMPFSRPEGSAGSSGSPREVQDILAVKELSPAFKEAVRAGDRTRALVLMMDIHESLTRWQRLDMEVEKFISASYFSLFLVFTFFIAAAALAVWFLHRALERSLGREQAGSVFSRALVLAQEQERSRIAAELHDTVAQDLRYLSLRVGKIGRTAAAAERADLCREVTAVQEKLMGRIRGICDGLVPPDFRFQGLPNALRRLCYDFGNRTGIDCRIDVAENLCLGPMNEEMQLQMFRIVQEALINVEKHAGATETIVTLRNSEGGPGKPRGIFISVSDDGRGFCKNPGFRWNPGFRRRPGASPARTGPVRLDAPPEGMAGHFGIRGMFERCAILNGALVIESEAGEGTIVYLEAPLEARPGAAGE
jgi:signal transduction histidine kinase